MLSDLACAVANGALVISDFRITGDQRELLGLVASVPTVWRTQEEIAAGGGKTARKVTAAVNAAAGGVGADRGPPWRPAAGAAG